MARPKSPAPSRAKRTAKTPKPKRGKVHVPPEPTGLVALGKRVAGYAVALGKPAAQRRAQFGWVKLPTRDGIAAEVFVIGGIPRKVRILYADEHDGEWFFDETAEDILAATGHRVGLTEKVIVAHTKHADGRSIETMPLVTPDVPKPETATRGTTLR